MSRGPQYREGSVIVASKDIRKIRSDELQVDAWMPLTIKEVRYRKDTSGASGDSLTHRVVYLIKDRAEEREGEIHQEYTQYC